MSADVLKVGHHGSHTSSSEEFIRAVNPSEAVISCGKDNDYGHPAEKTLKILENAGARVWRTDLSGIVIAVSDGKKVSVTSEK